MKDEALKLALEALKELVAQTEARLFAVKHDHVALQNARKTITAIKQALAAQPAPVPPVAWAEYNFKEGKFTGLTTDDINSVDSVGNWCQWVPQLQALAAPVQEVAATITITQRGSTRTIDNHFSDCVRDWPDGEYKLVLATPPAAQTEPVQEPEIKQGWDVDTLLDKPAAPVMTDEKGRPLSFWGGKSVEPIAQPAVQEPVLHEIEQYRMQMAGISTAALGYWKEGDSIHPDYDTPALRDVAKLYAKYAALHAAAQPAVPDALNPKDENPAYAAGWNDCRAEMLKGMK